MIIEAGNGGFQRGLFHMVRNYKIPKGLKKVIHHLKCYTFKLLKIMSNAQIRESLTNSILSFLAHNDNCPYRGNPDCQPRDISFYKPECCTKHQPCGPGEGQCSRKEDCLPGLICGMNNCKREGFPKDANCCWFSPGGILHLEKFEIMLM